MADKSMREYSHRNEETVNREQPPEYDAPGAINANSGMELQNV